MASTKGTALILEDEPLIAMDVENTLREAGHDVSIVSTCVEATEWLKRRRPDIVIADVVLRDGPCHDVVEQMVRDQIPFVVHSGNLADAHVGTPYAHGTWLNKPSLPDDLLAAVKQAMSNPGQP